MFRLPQHGMAQHPTNPGQKIFYCMLAKVGVAITGTNFADCCVREGLA